MVNDQSGYEGNAQRTGEEVPLDQIEVLDNEEKCKVQAYTVVTILKMTGKKIFHTTDYSPK